MSSQFQKDKAGELVEKGRARMNAGQYDEALPLFLEAADLFALDSNPKAQALQLQVVSEIYRLTGRLDQAVDTCKTMAELFQNLKDNNALFRVWNNMGLILTRLSRFQDALNCFQEAFKLSEITGDKRYMAQQLGNMGSACRDIKDYMTALEYYEKALQLYRELDHMEGTADQYTNIAYIHVMENRYEEALISYQKALPLYREMRNDEKARFTGQNIERLKGLSGKIIQ
jgi:tetratricopeptide (TPR) repeat protein